MVEIRIRIDKHGGESHVTALGHAGAGAKGHDLVCAAISADCDLLARAAEKLGCAGRISVGDGYMEIGLESYAGAKLAAAFAEQARGLCKQYPKNISLFEP